MKESMFFIQMTTGTTVHSRIEYFDHERTIKGFMNWINEKIDEVKKESGCDVVVNNLKFIK